MVGGARSSLVDFLGSLWQHAARHGPHAGASARPQRSTGEERYLALRERLGKRLQETARRLEGTLRTNHLATTRLGPQELIAYTRMLLWPDAALRARPHHDPCQPLAGQIPLGDVAVETASGSLLSDRWVFKLLSMAGVPRATSPGTITLPQQALGFFSLLDFIGEGFITVSAHAKPLQDVRTYLEKRRTFVRGGFAIPAKVDQLLKDCDLASYYIETDRRRLFDVQLSICVRARSEREAQELAEKIRDKASDIGVECRVEQHFAPSMIFQSLPFGFAPTIPEARRLFILPDRGLADLMPWFMLARGTRHGAMLLHNRLGEPFAFDPFDSPTAAHAVICGESGSGKSFLTNYLIYSVTRRANAQVFAIDKGRSYATATGMLGAAGSYHAMGLSAKTCINAFAGTLEASAAFLRQFIAHLASQVPSDRLTSDQLGIVDACISLAFRRKQQAVSWQHATELRERFPRGAWIDRQRKRLAVATLDEVLRAAVEGLKTRDSGRTPQFELLTRALLHGRRLCEPVPGGDPAQPPPVREEPIADTRSVIRAQHPGAAQEVIDELVGSQLLDDDSLSLFDSIPGEALIQHEVFFSDFIRELEAWRDQAAARAIATRLTAYHGTGALAGFFDGETQFQLGRRKLVTSSSSRNSPAPASIWWRRWSGPCCRC